MKVIEFFSGIGGVKCALNELDTNFEVIGAFDINDLANSVYRYNFTSPCHNRVIESLTPEYLTDLNADLWTMSPPCQPYTRNGNQLDLDDSRTSAMKHMLFLISKVKPKMIFFENVKGFDSSNGRNLLVSVLKDCNYSFQEFMLSPLQFGIPNSRLRYYLVAKLDANRNLFDNLSSLSYKPYFERRMDNCDCPVCTKKTEYLEDDHLQHYAGNIPHCSSLTDFIESDINDGNECYRFLDDNVLEKRFTKLDIVTDTSRKTCCFIKCYSRKIEGSGSYFQMLSSVEANDLRKSLETGDISLLDYAKQLKLRYFTPREIANLMCFPKSFTFPNQVTFSQRYRLLGNSVNVCVVAHLIHWLVSLK